MLLSLKVLNSDASLNNFQEIGTLQTMRGSDAKLILQLHQPIRKIRYIPAATAVMTITLKKSDNTTITKTATFPFADDRSIVQIDLDETETAQLISQNLNLKIEDGEDIKYAVATGGLQMISLTQGC